MGKEEEEWVNDMIPRVTSLLVIFPWGAWRQSSPGGLGQGQGGGWRSLRLGMAGGGRAFRDRDRPDTRLPRQEAGDQMAGVRLPLLCPKKSCFFLLFSYYIRHLLKERHYFLNSIFSCYPDVLYSPGRKQTKCVEWNYITCSQINQVFVSAARATFFQYICRWWHGWLFKLCICMLSRRASFQAGARTEITCDAAKWDVFFVLFCTCCMCHSPAISC